MKKKILASVLAIAMVATLGACGNDKGNDKSGSDSGSAGQAPAEAKEIHVISREEGSGTRGAFIEITKIKDGDNDNTRPDAVVQNSTDAAKTTVSGDPAAIGYISMGSMDSTVKAIKVNGVEATEENVLNDKYAVKRPFNIVYKEDKLTDATKDFINFIMSKEGQALAQASHVLAADGQAAPYAKSGDLSGKIRIQGSTSVTPFMEKLMEEYKKVQPKVTFDFTSNGSGAGITAAIEDQADLGMASREVKDEEKAKGLTDKKIAIDGICVIVNKDNACEDLTMDQIKGIFTGEIKDWSEVSK